MKISTLVSGVVFVGLAAVSGACGMGSTANPMDMSAADKAPMSGPTFHKDVQPILEEHCQGCHTTGGIAPMPLLTYQDAVTYAADIASKTTAKVMPPWGARATADCAPRFGFRSDPSLTDAEIATLSAWAGAGAPEGNAADAPTTGGFVPTTLSNPTNELQTKAPFSLSGSSDEFRCFVLDPKITSTQYMNGYDVSPGNKTIVHHVLVFAADSVSSITQKLDASGSYDCFGGPGLPTTKLVAAWAPGMDPVDLPSNVGMPMAAGTALVMQVHYHPHANASMAPDQTTFQMRLTSTKPQYFFDPELIGNFTDPVQDGTGLLPDASGKVQFKIPAGASNYVETMQFTPTQDILMGVKPQIFGIAAHMHLVGTSEQITIKRATTMNGDPNEECLLGVPAWDFNWQRIYQYDTDISKLPYLNVGDVLSVKCTYNNTMQNPALASSILEQGLKSPSDVSLGETTLDEMCLAGVAFIYPAF